MPVISSNSAVPQVSGGESWITGSPRSSARQIEPALVELAGEEAAQEPLGLLVVEAFLGLLVLHELDRVEEPVAADVADDRNLAELLEHAAELALGAQDVAAEVLALVDIEVRHRGRRGNGWPANVNPWANDAVPFENGSNSRSEAIIAPIGMYAEVSAFAEVMMSGW